MLIKKNQELFEMKTMLLDSEQMKGELNYSFLAN